MTERRRTVLRKKHREEQEHVVYKVISQIRLKDMFKVLM